MGLVIRFPDVWRNARTVSTNATPSEAATVVILPVVRIERQAEESSSATPRAAGASTRRRRRPGSRS